MTVGAEIKKQNRFAKILSSIWDEFVYGSHLLSLGLSAMVASVMIIIGEEISIPLLIVSYIIVQIVYTLNHYKEIKHDLETNPERAEHLLKKINLFPYLLLIYFVALLVLIVLLSNVGLLMVVFGVLVFGVFYLKNLTKIVIGFKNYYVAALWSVSSMLLPYMYYSRKIDAIFIFMFLFIFVRWLVNTTFFDLKDISGDKADGLKTIPAVIGVKKTLLLLSGYNVLSVCIIMFAILIGVMHINNIGLLLLVPYSFYYIFVALNADSARIRKLSYIMVDGEYVFWPLLLLLGGLVVR